MFDRMEKMAIFRSRHKSLAHILTVILISGAMIITVVRIFIKTGPTTRSDTMALAMGAKSLVILAYQFLTEHTKRFRKWASLKANAILNGLEIVFWAAVCFLGFQNLSRKGTCIGTACALGWIVIVLAILVTQIEVYVFFISYLDFRHYKRNGKSRSNGRKAVANGHGMLVS